MSRNDVAIRNALDAALLLVAAAEAGNAFDPNLRPSVLRRTRDEIARAYHDLYFPERGAAIHPDTLRNVRDALRLTTQTPIVATAVELLTALIEPPAVRPPSEPAGDRPAQRAGSWRVGSPVPVAPPRPETGAAAPAVSDPGVDN